MSLASYTVWREKLVIQKARKAGEEDKVLSLRALTVADFELLVRTHAEDIGVLWDMWRSSPSNGVNDAGQLALAGDTMERMALRLCADFPAMAGLAIACASDEPEQAGQAMMLPVGTQVVALQIIFNLTAEDFDGLKKLLLTLAGIVAKNVAPTTLSAARAAETQ